MSWKCGSLQISFLFSKFLKSMDEIFFASSIDANMIISEVWATLKICYTVISFMTKDTIFNAHPKRIRKYMFYDAIDVKRIERHYSYQSVDFVIIKYCHVFLWRNTLQLLLRLIKSSICPQYAFGYDIVQNNETMDLTQLAVECVRL